MQHVPISALYLWFLVYALYAKLCCNGFHKEVCLFNKCVLETALPAE